MIELVLGEVIDANNSVTTMMQSLHTLTQVNADRRGMLGNGALGDLLAAAKTIERISKAADLDATMQSAIRLREQLESLRAAKRANGNVWFEDDLDLIQECATQLKVAFADQARSRSSVLLTPAEARLYSAKEPLFGPDVFDRFAIANDDIAEAGKCLALERGTATVFHLMRVLEAGLRALGKELDIPYAPSWESYTSQLEKLLKGSNYDTLTPAQKAKRPFYQDVLGDLVAIKSAWRNPTMHIVRSYDPAQAKVIFETTKGLMQHLAKELSADPSTPISTGQSS